MTKNNKSTKKGVEASVSEETPIVVVDTKETQKSVKTAPAAFESNVEHEALTVKLKSGLYFKTKNLLKDLSTVWTNVKIGEETAEGYQILSDDEVVDYITSIK